MQGLRDRWYAYVPTLLAFVGGMSPMLMFIVIALPVEPYVRMQLVDRILLIVLPLAGASWAFFFIWTAWGVPWIDAGNDRLRFKRSPREYWHGQRFQIWAPCALLTIVGVTFATQSPVSDWLQRGWWTWETRETWGAVIAAIALVVGIGTYWFQKCVKRRLIRMLRRRQLCFDCGYDLRGNPAAESCPECGARTPRTPPLS